MFSFLSAIPIIGKVIDALAAYAAKKQDVALEKYKVDGTVNVQAMQEDTRIIQARVDLAKVMKDDSTTKWGHRLFIYPVGVWFTLIVAYCIFHPYFGWFLPVLALPNNLLYIPYAVIAYLFATAWKK